MDALDSPDHQVWVYTPKHTHVDISAHKNADRFLTYCSRYAAGPKGDSGFPGGPGGPGGPGLKGSMGEMGIPGGSIRLVVTHTSFPNIFFSPKSG